MATDIWKLHSEGYWAVIPTNLALKGDGQAVMGAGLALDAVKRFKGLAVRLGDFIRNSTGGLNYYDNDNRLVCFPTKYHWRDPSSMDLIQKNLTSLLFELEADPSMHVAIPRIGCGLGGLQWTTVRPLIDAILPPDRYILCEP